MTIKNKIVLFFLCFGVHVLLVSAETNSCIQAQCPQQSQGIVLLPVANDCEKYIYCSNGQPIIRSCQRNYYFNKTLQGCIPAKLTTCEECDSDQSIESKESVEDSNQIEESNLEQNEKENNIPQRCIDNSVTLVTCPQILPEDRLLPHPDDCQLFYYCINSELPPICRECPAGLHFNPFKNVCDHPSTAGCRIQEINEVQSSISKEFTAVNTEQCESNNGEYADLRPNPNNCNKYYVCDGGILISMDCPEGLHYNTQLKVCDLPQNARCENSNIATKTSKTIGELIFKLLKPSNAIRKDINPHENNISQRCIENSLTPVSCPLVLPEDRLLPHPDDCELFYYCINSQLPPICRDCPAGLHFNPIKKVCDHPATAGCKLQIKEENSNSIEFRSLRNSLPTCDPYNGVWANLQADPEDCTKYYVCDWGQLIHMNCPAGLHFSTRFKICDWPSQAECQVEIAAKTAKTHITSNNLNVETCESPNGEFADLKPHPTDCSKYYVCDWGRLILMTCPEGLHFSTLLNVCDLPKNARCNSTTINQPITIEPINNQDKKKEESVVCKTNIDEGYVEIQPDPQSCTNFYICTQGEPIRKSCPSNLHFNPTLLVCDYPESAGCESTDFEINNK